MYRRLLKYMDQDYIYITLLVLFSLAVRIRYFIRKLISGEGFPQSQDSDWYINYAYGLMTNFNIGMNMNDILYFGYNILLTLLLAICKDTLAIVFIQVVVSGISVVLVYKIALSLFNRTTAVISSLFYSLSWNTYIWSMYVLSDSFFISVLLLSVYYLVQYMKTRNRRYQLCFVAASMYMLVFRPTGILCFIFMMLSIVINFDKEAVTAFVRRHRGILGGLSIIAVAFGVYINTVNMLGPLIRSVQSNTELVLYNVYANGWIYDNPSSHDYPFKPDFTLNVGNNPMINFVINNWHQICMLYGKRIVALLGWWVWDIELHSIRGWLSALWHFFPTALFGIGTIAAIRNGRFRQSSVLWFVILAVFMFCIMVFIDGMYRYKAPSLPFIAIVAAYGADHIIRGVPVFTKKLSEKRL